MTSFACIVLEAADAGRRISDATLNAIPPFQWEVYWTELSALCPSKIAPRQVTQRNALRIELLPSTEPRCSRQSPDGRGLTWLLSGGEPLAYGACRIGRCPRARAASPTTESTERNDHDAC